MSYAESLISLLESKLPSLTAARQQLKDSGHAATPELNVAHSSLSTALEGLQRSPRPENEIAMLKQGIKYLRSASKTAEMLATDTDNLLKDLLAWEKGWNARPLPNEREANELVRDSIRRIAQKEPLPKFRALKDGGVEELSKGFGTGWEFFGRSSEALLLDGSKKSLSLKSNRPELPKRLFAELNKEFKKQLGKPKGGAKSKVYKSAGFELQVDLAAHRAPGGTYPFDIHALNVIVRKGTADLFGDVGS